MTIFRHLLVAVIIVFGPYSSALAQPHDHREHGEHHELPSGPVSEGVVRRIDKEAEKITIKHGRLHNLGTGPMTKAFQVLNPMQLGGLAVGDKVYFVAELVDGKLMVPMIEGAR